MRFYLRVLSLLGVFCLVAPSSWAGENVWTMPQLPEGGTDSLEINTNTTPAKLLLSSGYQSLDKGESWSFVGATTIPALPGASVIKKDSTTDTWYGLSASTFYKLVNGQWIEVIADEGFTLPPSYLYSWFGNHIDFKILAIAPTQPATIYVQIRPTANVTNAIDPSGDEIYRSQDGGKRWYKVYSLKEPKFDSIFQLNTLLVDPSSPNTLYILGRQNTTDAMYKLYISTNAGDTWTETAHPAFEVVSSYSYPYYINFLGNTLYAVNTTPTTLYVRFGGSISPVLFKTTATGNTWETISIPPFSTDRIDFRQNFYSSIELIPSTTSLYVTVQYQYDSGDGFETKLYKTTDNGLHWTELTSNLFPPSIYYQLLIDPEDENILYLATGNNILKSTDKGESWQLSQRGLKLRTIKQLFSTPTTTYALTDGELFQITDKGETWTNSNLLYPAIRFQTMNTTQEAIKVYGYTTDCKSLYVKQQGQDAVFYPLPTIFHQCSSYKQVVLHTVPYDSKTLYAVVPTGSGNDSSVQGDERTTPQVLKSTDDGATWTTLYTLLKQRELSLVVDPITPKTLYAVVKGLGIMRSVDDGATWELLTDKLTVYDGGKLTVVPTTPRTFLFTQQNGDLTSFFKSTDAGVTWVTDTYSDNNLDVQVIASESSYLLYILKDGVIYKNSDMGDVWCPVTATSSFLKDVYVRSFIKDSSDVNTFYLNSYSSIASYTATTSELVNQLGSYNLKIDTPIDAVITGGIKSDSCETTGTNAHIPLSATVEIQGSIEPLPEHIGQTADIIVYAMYVINHESVYFMLGENTIQVWDRQASDALSTLIPFKQGVTLQAKNDIDLYKGQFIATGALYIHFGYRLADGTVIVNHYSLVTDVY